MCTLYWSRRLRVRLVSPALAGSLVFLAACARGQRPASYLPAGAPAQYGAHTADGVVLLLAAPEPAVRAAVARGLAANGFTLVGAGAVGAAGRVLATAPRSAGGDTTLVIRAEVTPEDPSWGGVVVVISGTYSAPSARIRHARVVERPGERSPLYARLRAVADNVTVGARRHVAEAHIG